MYFLEHEIGHALGLYHAACTSYPSPKDCGEYGDCSDVMGCLGTGGGHNNGAHKVVLGWTRNQPSREVKLTTVAKSMTISLAPLGVPTSTIPQVVSLGNDNVYLPITYYDYGSHFVSYRVPDRSPSIVENIDEPWHGVHVHQQTGPRSDLLVVLKFPGQQIELIGKPDMYARIKLLSLNAAQANLQIVYFPLSAAPVSPVTIPLQYFPLAKPVRLIDSRSVSSAAVYAGPKASAAGASRTYYVAGFPGSGVPATARAIGAIVAAVSPASCRQIFPVYLYF